MLRTIGRIFALFCLLFAITIVPAAWLHSLWLGGVAGVWLIFAAAAIQFPLEFVWYFGYGWNHTLCWDCYRYAISGRGVISATDIAACKAARERADEARFFGYDIGHRPNRREW